MLNAGYTLQQHYHLLNTLGISVWFQKKTNEAILTDSTLLCSHCMVLLPASPKKLSVSEQKVLTGMLGVFEYFSKTQNIAWVNEALPIEEYPLIGKALARFAPYRILIMGEAFSKQILRTEIAFDELRLTEPHLPELSASIQVTYHPSDLANNPQNKAKAYRDLLALKTRLTEKESLA